MSDRFSSYFILGFFLVLAILLIFVWRNILLFKAAWKSLHSLRLKLILLLVIFTLPFISIGTSLLVNDSISTTNTKYYNGSIGGITAIVYPRIKTETWDTNKVNKITTTLRGRFSGTLPLFYTRFIVKNDSKGIEIPNTVIVNFNPNTASIFNDKLISGEIDFSLEANEALLSQTLANSLNVNKNDSININGKDITIRQIVEDNGLIGFNAPIKNNFEFGKGSVYMSQKGLQDLNLISKEETYNAVLGIDYNSDTRNEVINAAQNELHIVDPAIVIEELPTTVENVLLSGTRGLNPGQVLLILTVLPSLISIILVIIVLTRLFEKKKEFLSYFLARGNGRFKVNLFLIFENSILLTVAGIVGTAISLPVAHFILSTIKVISTNPLSRLNYVEILKQSITLRTIAFSYTGSWLILLLVLIFWSISISNFNFIAKVKNNITKTRDLFTTKKFFLGLLIIMLAGVLFYFVASNRITSPLLRLISLFSGGLAIIISIAYLLKFKIKQEFVVFAASLCVLLWSYMLYSNFASSNLWNTYPLLHIVIVLMGVICFSLIFISSLFYSGKVLEFLIPIKKLKNSFVIIYRFPLVNKIASYGITICITLIFTGFFLINPLKSYLVKQVSERTPDAYDFTIIDELGTTDIRSKVNNADLSAITKIQLTSAVLPQYKYKDLRKYDEGLRTLLPPESEYKTNAITVEKDFLNRINIISTASNPSDIFFESQKYILLGRNFAREPDNLNLRPDLKEGDNVTIKLNNVEISRTILGFIEPAESPVSLSDQTVLFESGMILSSEDAKFLQENQRIYFSSIYGLKFASSIDSIEKAGQLKEVLKNESVSSITSGEYEVQKSVESINILFNIVYFLVYLSLFLILVSLLLAKDLIFPSFAMQNLFKTNSGSIFISGILVQLFFGLLIANIASLYIQDKLIRIPVITPLNVVKQSLLVIMITVVCLIIYTFIAYLFTSLIRKRNASTF